MMKTFLFFHSSGVSVSHMANNVSHTRSSPPPAAAAPPSSPSLRRPPAPPRLLLASLIPAGHMEAPALNTPRVEEGD